MADWFECDNDVDGAIGFLMLWLMAHNAFMLHFMIGLIAIGVNMSAILATNTTIIE